MPPPKDPYRYFRLEARELLDALGKEVATLEQGTADDGLVQRMLRQAHTLKGAARVVKQIQIADAAHAVEDLLAPLRDERGASAPVEALSGQLTAIGAALRALALPLEEPAPGAPEPLRPQPVDAALSQTVRTDIDEIDDLLEGLSELHSRIGDMRMGMIALEEAQRMAALLEANLAPRSMAGVGEIDGKVRRAHALASDLTAAFGEVERDLATGIDQADRELGELRGTMEQMRLVPASVLFAPTEIAAREAAQMVGKQVRFDGEGGDTRLAPPVIEAMQRVLIQLVRNALAHGIGTTAQRATVNKPAWGTIRLTVARRRNQATFDFSDDGKGIDADALREVAKARGLPDIGDGEDMSDGLLRILMASGVSTAGAVSEVAGRGVGLDIVREAVEQLQGAISLRSQPGKGTTFRITVPLSLASIEVLHMESDGTRVAISLEAVETALRLEAADVMTADEGMSIEHEGALIPFMPLANLLHGAQRQEARRWSAIILKDGDNRAAIGVDRLLGASRCVVRGLPSLTPCDPIVAATHLDAQGNPRLLLDSPVLIAAVRGRAAPLPQRQAAAPHILVIDDSLTTRMLEESILLGAGYAVDTATSAEDGLEAARRRRYDLFLVDVEMPGMDGFSFVRTIRADPALHDIPAILISSRNAPEDFRQGTDAGAQGYMVKGEFDQKRLLTLIRDLAG